MTDILTTIDETLTYHSAGLGADLEVPVERYGEWVPFTTTDGSAGEYRLEGREVVWRIVVYSHAVRPAEARFLFSLPPFKTAAEREAEAARRGRLRHMRHLYRQRRRKW